MDNAISSATAAAAPSLLRTYGPLALAGTAVAAGTGMFEPVPGEAPGLVEYGEDGRPITGADLVRADPTKYLVSDLGSIVLNPETGQYESRASTSVSDLYPTYQMPTDYSVPTTFAANTQAPFLMGSTPGGPSPCHHRVPAVPAGRQWPSAARKRSAAPSDPGTPPGVPDPSVENGASARAASPSGGWATKRSPLAEANRSMAMVASIYTSV